MSSFQPGCHSGALPRAGRDPIADEATALAVFLTAAHLPARNETLVMLLDDRRRGIALVVVSGTREPDAVLQIAERVFDPAVHDRRVGAAVIASIRPGSHSVGDDPLADADRWLDLDEIAERSGVELVDWLVIGDGVNRPRQLVNAPSRWRPTGP